MLDYEETTIGEFENKYDTNEYEVWDEKKKEWVSFNGSCYIEKNEFPKPEEAKFPINLITIKVKDKVITLGNREYTGNSDLFKYYRYIPDEARLLDTFCKICRKLKIDVITGWNVHFDTVYIINRCKQLGVETLISPINKDYQFNEYDQNYKIPMVSILDYMELYKNFTYTSKPSYSLQAIGVEEIGEGKLEYEGAIYDIYKTDWNLFVEYNIQDVLLVEKIENKLKFLELAVNICVDSRSPLEKVFSSTYVINGLITQYLWKNNLVAPDTIRKEKESYPGGFVYAKAGYYKNVVSFDITSMYPHLMMQFNISPETLVENPEDPEGLISTPIKGVYYKKDKVGIIPMLVKQLFNDRKKYKTFSKIQGYKEQNKSDSYIKKELKLDDAKYKSYIDFIEQEGNRSSDYYDKIQLTKKILVNSVYGALGENNFKYYNILNASSVTLSGQALIKYLSNYANAYFKKKFNLKRDPVILIDSDSNYLDFSEIYDQQKTNKNFEEWMLEYDRDFVENFWVKVCDKYAKEYNTNNVMDFKREKIITKMLVLAKKKYITMVKNNEGKHYEKEKMSVTGFEIKRSDIPLKVREWLELIIKEIFNVDGKDKNKIVTMIKDFRKQYSKLDIHEIALSSGVSEYSKYCQDGEYYVKNGLTYTKGTPIHVRSSQNYNYMISLKKMKYQPVNDGAKIKYVYVKDSNMLNQNCIGFIGKWPDEFNEYFKIDYDKMFENSLIKIVQRLYDVLQWGKVSLNSNNLRDMF